MPASHHESPSSETSRPLPLMGLARVMRMAFDEIDLQPLASELIARASGAEGDADALMDLSTVLQLRGLKDLGLETQAHALRIKRLYEQPARMGPAIRLLALMTPGDLMANAPLPFLFEDSDIALSMLYLPADEAIPTELPPHDVAIVAVSDSSTTRDLLARLAEAIPSWPRPVVNRPDRIALTSRIAAHELMAGAPGIEMPATALVSREDLKMLSTARADLADVLLAGAFPLIVRPVDSHAGHGLAKIDHAAELPAYLDENAEDAFFISRFVDYRSADGLYRKYRVVLVDGIAYAGHMGVSAHWMIHYLNAGMTDSAAKRAEEEAFMRDFEHGFAQRHARALDAIGERFGLEYLVVDCAETAGGDLLLFEVDPGAVVHTMDPVDLFPYKPAHMRKVFAAFRAMLARAIETA
jgi:glutathione synthase/RimK-type ligase-like ATP-grasp enzyme